MSKKAVGPGWWAGMWLGVAAAVQAAGCSAGDSGTEQRGMRADRVETMSPEGAGSGASADDTTFGNAQGTISQPVPNTSSTRDAASGECPSIGRSAQPGLAPVDIVWTIDGSGSMVDEAERLQQNMDSFVATISDAGVDTRVVLVAQDDLVQPNSALAQSGNYLFVQADVGSHNALDSLIGAFPSYESFLRPQAHVHFIVVTDDESEYDNLGTPEARAEGFLSAMDGLLDADYTMHAVASPGGVGDPPCTPESVPQEIVDCCVECLLTLCLAPSEACLQHVDASGAPLVNPVNCAFMGGAASPGVTYFTLADQTSGVATSICAEDWTHVFGSLSDAVIESAPLPCNYPIPEPPPGMNFERDKVNVRYTPTGTDPSAVDSFPFVEGEGACGDRTAWHYDAPDEPSEVLLCPAACEAVSSAEGGQMEIVFGCDTETVE